MLYFKHLINKFCFKVKSSNLFKFFFGCVFLFFFIPNVFAYESGGYDLSYGNSVQFYNYASASYTNISNLTTSYNTTFDAYSSAVVNTGNYGIASGVILNGFVQPNHWYMLVYATSKPGTGCGMPGNFTNQFKVAPNFNTGVSSRVVELVNPGVLRSYVNSSVDTYDACIYSVAFRVNQLSDRILMPMNSASSDNGAWVFFGYYLSDMGSSDSLTGTQLNSAIYDTRQSIINMQNSINSNIDSESTAIQNKIDSAKNQAHSDHQALMNQDHSYNNNPSESLNGRHDLDEYSYESAQLRNALVLDSSDLDVSFNTNASNFIWSFVTNIRNTNAKFTIFLTAILSLGIIKLILNR